MNDISTEAEIVARIEARMNQARQRERAARLQTSLENWRTLSIALMAGILVFGAVFVGLYMYQVQRYETVCNAIGAVSQNFCQIVESGR